MAEPSRAIARALALAAAHPQVTVGSPRRAADGAVEVDLTFDVPMPNAWHADGASPNGVRIQEVVRFQFPENFPGRAMQLSLRPDFPGDLAHMMPYRLGERPVPCVVDGPLPELLAEQGFAGVLNQTALWLEHAAQDALIDRRQGWEPTRRDWCDDFVLADEGALRALVTRDAGHAFFEFRYRAARGHTQVIVRGEIESSKVTVNLKSVERILESERVDRDGQQVRHGSGLALIVWPGREATGKLRVCDRYTPETVGTFGDLRERAALFGCERPLEDAVAWLARCFSRFPASRPVPLSVILCARRPFPLIDSDSDIELCTYVLDVEAPRLLARGDETPVRPAALRHRVTRQLLARMTGDGDASVSSPWTLVGAGSLGSKIALHLARAGRAPSVVIDKALMGSHNAARHALIPPPPAYQFAWLRDKTELLAEALSGLDQTTVAVPVDIAEVLAAPSLRKKAFPRDTSLLVNTTASLVVRELLASAPPEELSVPVVEAALYAGGQVGLIAAEGPRRNPNVSDLIATFYACCGDDDDLRKHVFDSSELVRLRTGEGCGSLTMPMSDGRLSLFGAGAGEYVLARLKGERPTGEGELLIGRLADGGLGLRWETVAVPEFSVVSMAAPSHCTVRVHPDVIRKIDDEIARWPGTETGGVLVGRYSEFGDTFTVVDLIPAPEDSRRSSSEFVLGTRGLRATIDAYTAARGGSLFCIGTWHSHLVESGFSRKDERVAAAIALARSGPSILLLRTPAGLRALLADATTTEEVSY